MNTTKRILAATMAAGLLALAGQAGAHAHLLTSIPAANADVPMAKSITLHMSEALEPKFSGLELSKVGGGVIPTGVLIPKGEPRTMIVELPQSLASGAYKVSWHAVAADGHKSQGEFAFKVH